MDNKVKWHRLSTFTKFKLIFWSMTLILICMGIAIALFWLGGTMTIESPLPVKIFVACLSAGCSFVGPGISIAAISDGWPNEKGY